MSEQADAVIEWIGSLQLAGGDHDGEPFEVLPWQRRAVRGVLGHAEAAISTPRGNGKSAFVAAVAAAVVDPDGPLTGRRREVVVVAPTFNQAAITFEDVLAFVAARHDLDNRRVWRKQETVNVSRLEHRPTGARVRCVSSRPAGLHGLRPALMIIDEPAQLTRSERDRVYAAASTSLSSGSMSGMS